MTDVSDRLGYVLDGLSFPVDRWELIARAEHYGADATTLHELRSLSEGRYGRLTEVVNAIAEERHWLHRPPAGVSRRASPISCGQPDPGYAAIVGGSSPSAWKRQSPLCQPYVRHPGDRGWLVGRDWRCVREQQHAGPERWAFGTG